MIRGDGEGLVGVLLLPLTMLVWWALLLPLPAPLGLLCEALGLTVLRGRFSLEFALFAIEDSTYCLLAEGKVGCYIKQLVHTEGRVPSQLAYEIPARCAQMNGTNDFGVGDAGELGALLGEASDVVSQGLVGLLTAPSEVPRISRTHVCALKIAHEGSDQVGPIVDLIGGKMFEPCTCRICKV